MGIHELNRGLTAKNQDSQSCCIALAPRGCRGEASARFRAPCEKGDGGFGWVGQHSLLVDSGSAIQSLSRSCSEEISAMHTALSHPLDLVFRYSPDIRNGTCWGRLGRAGPGTCAKAFETYRLASQRDYPRRLRSQYRRSAPRRLWLKTKS